MIVEFSEREEMLMLAALRCWQDLVGPLHLEDEYEAYFEADEPLSTAEIDSLCQRIAAVAAAARRG